MSPTLDLSCRSPQPPQRLTIEGLRNTLIGNSAIRRWADGDRSKSWVEAVEADETALNAAMKQIACDLSFLTSSTVESPTYQLDLHSKKETHIADCMKTLASEFEQLVVNATSGIAEYPNGVRYVRAHDERGSWKQQQFLPEPFTNIKIKGGVTEFWFTNRHNYTKCELRAMNPQLIPISEYRGPLSWRARKAIAKSNRTKYDYQPIVMSCYTVAERLVIDGPWENHVRMTDYRTVRRRETGIVLQILENYLLVELASERPSLWKSWLLGAIRPSMRKPSFTFQSV